MPSEPHSDLGQVIGELAAVRTAIRSGSYQALTDQLLSLLDRDERLMAIAGGFAADEPGFYELVESQLAAVPSDILAMALFAQARIARGWSICGKLPAEHVSAEQFEQFVAQLNRAESTLIELCALEPSWSYPWYLRLITARGLGLGLSEARRRYGRLADPHPQHFPAQAQLLQYLSPKWGGTWEEAFGFAREQAAAAPPGSATPGLVADVHLEYWLGEPEQRADYLARPSVLAELRQAAQASVAHPQFDGGFSWVRLHSTFGVLYALAGQKAEADYHLARLPGVVDAGVWGYLGPADRARVLKFASLGAA